MAIPTRPAFETSLDPDTGLLKGPLEVKPFDPVELNTGALERMREVALGRGESPWAKLMLERQGLEQVLLVLPFVVPLCFSQYLSKSTYIPLVLVVVVIKVPIKI